MLRKIQIPPGIDRDSTQYAAAGHWYDMNNMRFRGQVPEVIGGWSRDGEYTLQGLGREVFSSRDFEGNNYQFVGTDWKLYTVVGTLATDITPIKATTTETPPSGGTVVDELDNPFDFTDGSSLLDVAVADHGLSVNDWMNFNSVDDTSMGNFTEAILEQVEGFQVAQVVDDNNLKLWIVDWSTGDPVDPGTNGSALGGLEVEFYTRVASGTSSSVEGNGFGAGDWGGDGIPTPYLLNATDGLTITVGIATSEARITGRTAPSVPGVVVAGDQIYIMGLASETVEGVPTDFINNQWWEVTAIDSNDIDFTLATSGGTGGTLPTAVLANMQTGLTGSEDGGGGDGMYYRYDTSELAVDGASRGWGDASIEGEITATLRRVYMENFGEDMMFCNSGGPIYYWDTSAKVSSGIPITGEDVAAVDIGDTDIFAGTTGAPVTVDSFLISKRDGHVIALGANDLGATTMNTMLVRWSDQNNPFDWTPSTTNTSGGQVLRVGSRIIGGVSTKDEVLIFTNSAVYSMRYLGPNSKYVFGFNLITEGVEILSPRVAANAANSVFFMGLDGFYIYTGSVSPLPCPVKKYVFDDFNTAEKGKCFAAVNSSFSEVMWFYPSSTSFECDRYVVYNYSTDTWGIGAYDMKSLDTDGENPLADPTDRSALWSNARSSWRDSIVFSTPMATYVYNYEPNGDADTGQPSIQETAVMVQEDSGSVGTAQGHAMSAHIESGEIDISDGDRFVFISEMIPDLQVFNSTAMSPVVTVDVYGRDFPGEAQATPEYPLVRPDSYLSADVTFTGNRYTPIGNATAMRARARSIAVRLSSSKPGFQWRTGDMRFAIQPDGRR